MSLSPFASWLLLLALFVLAWLGAGRFDRWLDRVMRHDLDAVKRRDKALRVMESWHPSQGPKPASHTVKPEKPKYVPCPNCGAPFTETWIVTDRHGASRCPDCI